MQLNLWAMIGLSVVVIVSLYVGQRTVWDNRSGTDFFLARRTVRSRRNAAAIAGGSISAASFLGVTGLVLKQGADALWFPVGFTAGFLMLMILVAAPMRRSGAHTLPDFLEERLDSSTVRRTAALIVVLTGIMYLLPQLQAGGLVLNAVVPTPSWVGSIVVAIVMTITVLSGALRAFTLVQAFQYWLKLFAFAVPTFVLCLVFVISAGEGAAGSSTESNSPVLTEDTTVTVENDVRLRVDEHTPVRVGEGAQEATWWAPDTDHQVSAGTTVVFPAGASVPVAEDGVLDNASWLRPAEQPSDMWWAYSVLVATFFGVLGLPHVLMRFYTNPDGKAARRSAGHLVLLLGLFALFPILLGVLARQYVPNLLMTDRTDAAVLELPSAVLPGISGQVVTAVLAAGAFAALLSTSSGILVSISVILATDIFPGRGRDFRFAIFLVALIPVVLALLLPAEDLVLSVGMAFAFVASTCCPPLVLGIWWRKFTRQGALAGMGVGAVLVLIAIALSMVSAYTGGWAPWFVTQPALLTVPAAFFITILVSLGTTRETSGEVNAVMLRMHAPDPLGFASDREEVRSRVAEKQQERKRGRHRK